MPYSRTPVYIPYDLTSPNMGADNVMSDSCANGVLTESIVFPALDAETKNSTITLSENNLTHTGTDAAVDTNTKVNFPLPDTGKFYFEFLSRSSTGISLGVCVGSTANNESGSAANKGFLYSQANGKFYAAPITAGSGDTYGATWTTGDVIGVAIDMTNGGDLWFAKNNTWQSSATASEIAAGTTTNAAVTNMPTNTTGGRSYDGSGLFIAIGDGSASGKGTLIFDSKGWTYTPPTGFGELTRTITGVGNFATLNPLATGSAGTFDNGNLTVTPNNLDGEIGTIGLSSGKWYWECTQDANGGEVGVYTASALLTTSGGGQANGVGSFDLNFNGRTHNNPIGGTLSTSSDYSQWAFASGDTVGVALDMDAGKIWFHVNGTYLQSGSGTSGNVGNPATGSNEMMSGITTTVFPMVGDGTGTAANSQTVNFGQKPFKYTVPTGFNAGISTHMLSAPAVKNPDDGFVFITLEDGDTIEASLATARAGFGSYIEVFKREDSTDEDYDVRFSDDSGNSMHFNTNAAAGSEATLASGVNYSAWAWRVGATYGCYTAEISHTNGSATNQAHSLGSGAKTAVAKRSSDTGDWYVSHPNLSSANIRFNVQEATTSELVTVDNTNVTLNSSFASGTYRVIVWEQIEGFSRFMGYSHNGSTSDGPYLNFGGSPSLVAWRNIDSSNYNDFFATFPSYTSNGDGNPTDIRYNWGNGEKGSSGITIGDVTANGYKMRPSSGKAFGSAADDPMLVWAWGLRPFGNNTRAWPRGE